MYVNGEFYYEQGARKFVVGTGSLDSCASDLPGLNSWNLLIPLRGDLDTGSMITEQP